MPRLAYLSKSKEEFFQRLDKLMDLAAKSLHVKREALTVWLNAGLYPYTKFYLGNFNNHFSTIGLVGMNEAGLNACWLRKDMTHKETQDFTEEVLNHMRERLSDYQEEYGDLYNLEATPAESTTYRFAKHDKERYPDIITANEHGTPYYTNSSHLPVGYTEDIFSALDVQDRLQVLYTSGTVFHGFLGEKLPDWQAAMQLVKKISDNYHLPYYTLSPTYSICTEHGYLTGEQYTCPICGKKTEVYSRITGYYRAVQNWNDGKVQEFQDRKTYDPMHSHLTHTGPIETARNDQPLPAEATEIHADPAASGETVCTPDGCHIAGINLPAETAESSSADQDLTKPLLVTTHTCPNCKAIKQYLQAQNIAYDEKYADDDPSWAQEHHIMTAPTMILPNGTTLTGVGPIRKYFQ